MLPPAPSHLPQTSPACGLFTRAPSAACTPHCELNNAHVYRRLALSCTLPAAVRRPAAVHKPAAPLGTSQPDRLQWALALQSLLAVTALLSIRLPSAACCSLLQADAEFQFTHSVKPCSTQGLTDAPGGSLCRPRCRGATGLAISCS